MPNESDTTHGPTEPKVPDQARAVIRTKHYSPRTEEAYVQWIERYLVEVLHLEIGMIDNLIWPKKPGKLPVVPAREEVAPILSIPGGIHCHWIHGQPSPWGETAHDGVFAALDEGHRFFVWPDCGWRRQGRYKDRVTILPDKVKEPFRNHLEQVKRLHDDDLREGYGDVYLPHALAVKYPNAGREWGWQYVFPASQRSVDPRTGAVRRHHPQKQVLQSPLKDAVRRAGVVKTASCHSRDIRLQHTIWKPAAT